MHSRYGRALVRGIEAHGPTCPVEGSAEIGYLDVEARAMRRGVQATRETGCAHIVKLRLQRAQALETVVVAEPAGHYTSIMYGAQGPPRVVTITTQIHSCAGAWSHRKEPACQIGSDLGR